MPSHGDNYPAVDYEPRGRAIGGLAQGTKTDRVGRLAELLSLVAEIDGRLGEASGRLHMHLDRIGAPNPPEGIEADSPSPGREPKELPMLDLLQQQLTRVRHMVRELETLVSRTEQL